MNIDQIRARLNNLANFGKKKRDIWKPKDEHTIRCVPYRHGDEPFLELGFHYDIGDTRSILCPKFNFGEDCAVCELADRFKSWNNPDGTPKEESVRKADFEFFRKIQIKERYYVPMIERGKESDGVKFWGFGKMTMEELLKICSDGKWNELVDGEGSAVLFDPDCALDLKIEFKPPGEKGNNKPFGITEVDIASLKPSKLASSKAEAKKLVESVQDILDVYPKMTSDEVRKVVMKFAAGTEEPAEGGTGTEYESNTEEKPVEGGLSVDEAFADMAD